jgi:hypothetical protein
MLTFIIIVGLVGIIIFLLDKYTSFSVKDTLNSIRKYFTNLRR